MISLCCPIQYKVVVSMILSFLQCIISSLSLATFAVNRSKVENRLQLSIMLVLITVTFKFVTNQVIPKISYVTHLVRTFVFMLKFELIAEILSMTIVNSES